jgi:hypothetical protein
MKDHGMNCTAPATFPLGTKFDGRGHADPETVYIRTAQEAQD